MSMLTKLSHSVVLAQNYIFKQSSLNSIVTLQVHASRKK